MSTINKILVGVILALLSASFIGGCQYGKKRVTCPEIVLNDTIWVYDTAWVTIHDTTYYPLTPDTVTIINDVPADIDTAAILQKYYNKYSYVWSQKDSSINIDGYTVVSQNEILQNEIKYKWLKPTTVNVINDVDNSITYNKYIYFGLDVPVTNIQYLSLEAMYAFPKGYAGISYHPELKAIGAKLGVKLIKFK